MTRYLMYCVNAAFNHGQGDIASNTRRFEIFSEYVYDIQGCFSEHTKTHTNELSLTHVLALMHKNQSSLSMLINVYK